jgi:shikimate kinase
VVLIGLPGAGKTTVAPLVAALLDTGWTDLDQLVVTQSGQSIVELFATAGEPAFRELERSAMHAAVAAGPQVIAAGGGWAVQPGNLASVAGRAMVIYLSVAPEIAAARLGGAADRPLLAGPGTECVRALLDARIAWYLQADIELPIGESAPDAVAAGVATAARQYAGW